MRKLLRYMKGYRKKALLAPLFKLLEASMELCVPLIVKAIIDRGIGQEDRPFLIKMTLLMVLFGLLLAQDYDDIETFTNRLDDGMGHFDDNDRLW